MEFQPKSERELRDAMVTPAGIYDFECVGAEAKTSEKGYEMIALKHKVYTDDGAARYVKDWLVGSDAAGCQAKIRHFCYATGLGDTYEAGALDAYACTGVSGKLKLTVKEDPKYGLQNNVADYIVPKDEAAAPEKTDFGMPSAAQQAKAKAAMPSDDEVPF